MKLKVFYSPNKYKIILFLVLFAIVFFIPYLKADPAPGTDNLITPGYYPLIFIFLASLVVVLDLLTGTLVLRDLLFFFSFLISFLLIYTIACAAVYALIKKNIIKDTDESGLASGKDTAVKNSYVVSLKDNE